MSTKTKQKVKKQKQNKNKDKKNGKKLTTIVKPIPLTKSTQLMKTGTPLRIRHVEKVPGVLKIIVTAEAMNTWKLLFNPARSDSLPWIWSIGQHYKYYMVNSLKFEFRTSAPTTTKGRLAMYVDPDVNNYSNDDNSMTDFTNNNKCVTSDMYTNRSLVVDNSIFKGKTYFCKTTTTTLQPDRLADTCIFRIATENLAETTVNGEVYCEYDVTFKESTSYKPTLGAYLVSNNTGADIKATPFIGMADYTEHSVLVNYTNLLIKGMTKAKIRLSIFGTGINNLDATTVFIGLLGTITNSDFAVNSTGTHGIFTYTTNDLHRSNEHLYLRIDCALATTVTNTIVDITAW